VKLKVNFVGVVLLIIFVSSIFAQQTDFPVLKGPYFGQKPPGQTPQRFKPEVFKRGKYAEPVFLFSADGRECIFTASGGIYFTELKNGIWTTPSNTNTYGGFTDFEPNLSPDGKRLFFNSLNRPLPAGIEKPRVPIFVSERTINGWTKPEYLGFGGMYATLSDKGNIYFTIRKDGVDCLAMKRFVNGKNQDTEIIPAPVYSKNYHDQHPCIAPDGSFLIFDSENRPKKNQCGLFISFKQPDGSWTEPVNLGDFIKQDNAALA